MSLEDRYIACMVLGCIGDTMGFKNGIWEFETSGERIHNQLHDSGGISQLFINYPEWKASDDTIMHIATAEGLLKRYGDPFKSIIKEIGSRYVYCWQDMDGRYPGVATGNALLSMSCSGNDWDILPFDENGGGSGAAMRTMCIGLLYYRKSDIKRLVRLSIESGRITHHHPTGYLGGLASALFTSFAIRDVPITSWGRRLLRIIEKYVVSYITKSGRYPEDNLNNLNYFVDQWKAYLQLRNIYESGADEPLFPEKFDVNDRDLFYKSISYSGCGGSSGHDCPMIAYDALLYSRDNWTELCLRGVLHGGDSDTTGTVAASLYGSLYGFEDVPMDNYNVEFMSVLTLLGRQLYLKRE